MPFEALVFAAGEIQLAGEPRKVNLVNQRCLEAAGRNAKLHQWQPCKEAGADGHGVHAGCHPGGLRGEFLSSGGQLRNWERTSQGDARRRCTLKLLPEQGQASQWRDVKTKPGWGALLFSPHAEALTTNTLRAAGPEQTRECRPSLPDLFQVLAGAGGFPRL